MCIRDSYYTEAGLIAKTCASKGCNAVLFGCDGLDGVASQIDSSVKNQICLLYTSLWGTEEFIDENALQVNFTRLRKTLREFGLEERIERVRGQGYRLKEQVRL